MQQILKSIRRMERHFIICFLFLAKSTGLNSPSELPIPQRIRVQMESDFDKEFEKTVIKNGASSFQLNLPHEIPQELDFAFTFNQRSVAVEIEKSNREKFLRDILKCHMYLYAGADFSAIVLPKNYAHKHGVWDLFEFGVQRFKECQIYGFGTKENLGRIILIGFEQFDVSTNERFSREGRERIRRQANRDRRK